MLDNKLCEMYFMYHNELVYMETKIRSMTSDAFSTELFDTKFKEENSASYIPAIMSVWGRIKPHRKGANG